MTDLANPLENIIKSLDREAEQESLAEDHRESFFDGAPSEEVIVGRAREYDDIEKHLVRREEWLAVAKKLFAEKGGPLRLLTLPGRHRLEIELYRDAGLFGAGDLEELPVVGFETSPDVFGLLATTRPSFLKLYHDDLLQTLIDTKRRFHEELLGLFPFDIINLDLTINLVAPSEGPYGPVLEAIRQCFKLQGTQTRNWALMVTFRAVREETSDDLIQKLVAQYQENLEGHPKVKEACYSQYGTTSASKILESNPEEALAVFAAKWIVEQAHSFDLRLVRYRRLAYVRDYERSPRRYTICKLILTFSKERLPPYEVPGRAVPVLSSHIDDLVEVVKRRERNVTEMVRSLEKSSPQYLATLEGEIERLKAAVDRG